MKRAIIFSLLMAAPLLFCTARAQASAELHERAKNLYDVRDYRAALNLCERILAKNPDDGTAADLSAWCLRYLGERKSAEDMYEKALTMLKGEDAVWALIGLGEIYLDGEVYDRALSRLQEALLAAPKNQEASERASRGIELAKKALEKSSPVERQVTQLNDVEDRQKEVFNVQNTENTAASAPDPDSEPRETKPQVKRAAAEEKKKDDNVRRKAGPAKPPKTPQPGQKTSQSELPAGSEPTVVYGVTLRSNIDEALDTLKKKGHVTVDAPFLKKGRMYYPLRGLPAGLPRPLTDGATMVRFYITAYNEAVLSVIVQLDYDRGHSFDDVKSTLWKAFYEITGKNDTRGVRTSDNMFSYEAGVSLSNSCGVWMYATDKLDGTYSLEIEHVDLTNLSYYWMAGGK
ncbi:MAG: hypothetical protein LBT65_07700 [Synergistaceae bacterium]|nr:hypothetical protein [Synergistaceae bacterium]